MVKYEQTRFPGVLKDNVEDEKEKVNNYRVRDKDVPAPTSEKNTDATASVFGWEFQIATAIVESLQCINELDEVIVEGKTEDIEIRFSNNRDPEYLQAKAIQKANEKRTDSEKLTRGLDTLINTSNRTQGEYSKLVYICNYDNPLSLNLHNLKTFWQTHSNKILEMKYNDLINEGKEYVDKYIKKAKKRLKDHGYNYSTDYFYKNKLYVASHIYVNDETKNNTLDTELEKLFLKCKVPQNTEAIREIIIEKLTSYYFDKAGIENINCKKSISKKDLIWHILLPLIDRNINKLKNIPDEYCDIVRPKIDNFFSKQINNMSNINKVLLGYNLFKKKHKDTSVEKFINAEWTSYADMVLVDESDAYEENIRKYGTQSIMRTILRKQLIIGNIKEGTSLK